MHTLTHAHIHVCGLSDTTTKCKTPNMHAGCLATEQIHAHTTAPHHPLHFPSAALPADTPLAPLAAAFVSRLPRWLLSPTAQMLLADDSLTDTSGSSMNAAAVCERKTSQSVAN